MTIEFAPAFEAPAFSGGDDRNSLFVRLSQHEFEGSRPQQFKLENGLNRTTQVDANGDLIAVNDSDGKQRHLDPFTGFWRLYVDGNRVNTGYDIADVDVSADGKLVTMGVIGQFKGVIIETPKGTIAARDDGKVTGTNDEVMEYREQVLEALKKFLASPESNKTRGIKV